MNKILSSIIGGLLGITMAASVGVATFAGSSSKEAKAEETTATLSWSAKSNGEGIDSQYNAWIVTSDATESNFDSDRGIHFGTNSSAVSYIQVSTTAISGTVSKVVVNASGNNTPSLSCTIGGIDLAEPKTGLTTSNAAYTFEGSQTAGEIIVKIYKSASANKALYIKSIAVTYVADSQGGGGSGESSGTYQHVFNAKPSTGNAVTLSNINWNITATNLNGYNSSNYAGVQIGTSKANGSISLTSSYAWGEQSNTDPYGCQIVTEVRLWLNKGGTSVTPTVSIGGTSATSDGTTVVKNSSAGSDWTKATKVTFTPATGHNTGVVVINVSTVLAGYICAMEIDYDSTGETTTYDYKDTITLHTTGLSETNSNYQN